MNTPQIIREIIELEALDRGTLLVDSEEVIMPACDWRNDYLIDSFRIFPLMVIASGNQVRAARKALQGEA